MWFGSEKYGTPEVYQGQRTAKALDEYAMSRIPSYVTNKLTAATLPGFLSSSSLPCVVLLSSSASVSPMYKALSRTYRDRFTFGQVAEKTAAFDTVKTKYGVKSLPSLLVINDASDDTKPQVYNGPMKLKDISEWLKKLAASSKKAGGKKDAKKDDIKPAATSAKDVKELIPLLTSEHISAIQESTGYTVILFVDTSIKYAFTHFALFFHTYSHCMIHGDMK